MSVLFFTWNSACFAFQLVISSSSSQLLHLQWTQSYPVLSTGRRCNKSPKTLWHCQTSRLPLCFPHILISHSPTVPTYSHFNPFLCPQWATAKQKVTSFTVTFLTVVNLHWLVSFYPTDQIVVKRVLPPPEQNNNAKKIMLDLGKDTNSWTFVVLIQVYNLR